MCIRLKRAVCYISIVVLLPYIVTVFMNGRSAATWTPKEKSTVKVRHGNTVSKVSLDEYGIGRMAKEIPVDYEKETLKAQAILVRTDILKQIRQNPEEILLEDFLREEEVGKEWKKLKSAWDDTEGQVLLYENELAETPFFRISNGNTRDGKEVLGENAAPYLTIVDCPLDLEAPDGMKITVTESLEATVEASDTAGYVTRVKVGETILSGEEFRKQYSLPSSAFTLQNYQGKTRITSRGIGHGLGMSQYTANEMAKLGKKAEEILDYFYKGTQIETVAQIVRRNE